MSIKKSQPNLSVRLVLLWWRYPRKCGGESEPTPRFAGWARCSPLALLTAKQHVIQSLASCAESLIHLISTSKKGRLLPSFCWWR